MLHRLIYLLLAVAVGKACQYAAVDRFEARIGFAAASLIGLVPFILLLFWLSLRYPRWFGRR